MTIQNGAPPPRPDDLTPAEARLSDAAIDAFTIAIGGRAALLEALEIANGTPEVDKVLRLLDDFSYRGWPLRRLCATAGLTIADLFTAYKSALTVRAHLQATKIVTDHLAAVVTDVMHRSQPHEIPCTECGGLGQVTPEPTKDQPNPSPQTCELCRGTGRLLQLPDLDRQKVALELGQLITKAGGINLLQNQNTLIAPGAVGFGPGAIDQLQEAVAEILTPRARRPPTVIEVDSSTTSPSNGAST